MKYFSLCIFIIYFSGCAHQTEITKESFFTHNKIQIPLTPLNWQISYDGGGAVSFNPDGTGDIILKPQIPKTAAETYAALVLLKSTNLKPLKDYVVQIEVTTVRQLRVVSPNEWEVFWFMGNYRSTNGPDAKQTNYFMLKPNAGAELGRAFEQVGQSFLKTDSGPRLPLNVRQTFTYIKKGQHFQVYQQVSGQVHRDRKLVLDYMGKGPEDSLYDHPGSFGLYAEDALVRVHSFVYEAL